MASASLTPGYLESYRRMLLTETQAQVDYHAVSADRNEAMRHALHRAGITLFWMAVGACVLHLAFDLHEHRQRAMESAAGVGESGWVGEHASSVLTFLAALLPALGAAFAGISSQGEFGRIAQRSRAMALRLEQLMKRLRVAQPATSSVCGAVAEEATRMMTEELHDWQITFRSKPLDLPS